MGRLQPKLRTKHYDIIPCDIKVRSYGMGYLDENFNFVMAVNDLKGVLASVNDLKSLLTSYVTALILTFEKTP